MELLVVVAIIGIMGAIAYPSIRAGLASVRYQQDKQALALFFKRALIMARLDGQARRIQWDKDTGELVSGKKRLKPFHGKQPVLALLKDDEACEAVTVSPHGFCRVGVRFKDRTITVDLYTGKVEESYEP